MFKNNLSSRIRTFALIPTIVIGLILTCFLIYNNFNNIDANIEEKGLNILMPLSIISEPALKSHETEVVTALINQTHRKYASFIKSIAVFDKNNELITTSNFYKNFSSLKIQSLYQLPVTPELYHIDDKYYFYAPIYNTTYNLTQDTARSIPVDNLLGYISVELNTDAYTLRKYQEVSIIIAVILLGYLIAIAIGQRLMHDVSHPINNMIEVIDRIRQGHLDARINGELLGELDTLKKGINDMAISLGDFHRETQQNVEQTTSDLRETLEQLEIQNIELDIAKKRAQEAVRIKSEFLANMTHELRTPLNGIIGFTQQMMKTNLAPNQLDYLKTIEKSGGNLLSIINDILDFSRLESGKLTLEHILFDFEKMLDEVIHFQAPIAHEKGLEINLDIQSNVPHSFIGDPLRIQRIITNLIGNAIKFTSKGNIDISVQLKEIVSNVAEIEISIQDQGIGISKQQQDTIFHAFQQADTSISRSYGGTGLGLVISQKLVERMDGNIGVTSQLDHGSTFFFTLKLPVNKLVTEEINIPHTLRQRRILLIENNKKTALIHQNQLEEEGLRVTTANAFDKSMTDFDCAIIGITADTIGFDSQELVKTLSEVKKSIPHIIVTLPSTALILADKLFNIGVTSCLDRPISKRKLIETLAKELVQTDSAINQISPKYPQVGLTKLDMQVLAVDDNPANLKLISALLSDIVTHVDNASDGAQAVSLAYEKKYDIIFMDIQMPVMDGISATKEIRKVKLNNQTPVIAVTAHTMDGDKRQLIAQGMDDYLAKPIHEEQLIKKINKWFNCEIPTLSAQQELPSQEKTKSIDWSIALKQSANKEDLTRDLLSMLIKSFDDIKRNIEAAFIDDSVPLVDIIHKLHGSSAYSGTLILKQLCQRVEKDLRSGGSIEDIEPELFEIMDEMENIKAEAVNYL